MLVVMMLSGPVIQNRTSVGTTARVLMYVDASASMKATDEQMETQRKLRILRRLGWLEGGRMKLPLGMHWIGWANCVASSPRWRQTRPTISETTWSRAN